MAVSPQQQAIIQGGMQSKVFLEGVAGTGKTTVGVERLRYLLELGVDGGTIWVWIPQRTLAMPYEAVLNTGELGAGGQVNLLTLGGVSRRMVDLFWPMVADAHGFKRLDERPVFLSLEAAQYFMAQVAGPVIDAEGLFDGVKIDRGRLYSQVIDNLNKAAVVGFPHTTIGDRLKDAWNGDSTQLNLYEDVQRCAFLFREYCLEYSLLDFSLQVEVLRRLWAMPLSREYLVTQARHIIADNVEEDPPVAHELLAGLLAEAQSAVVISDSQAGYRRFLGAAPEDLHVLVGQCETQETFTHSWVMSGEISAFGAAIANSLDAMQAKPEIPSVESTAVHAAIHYDDFRYHPEMIDGVAEHIAALVHEQGVPPQEIVVLAPYLSDALRFSLMNRLHVKDVPVRSHRPSRTLREEPAAQCLLTLAQIAHPDWGLSPVLFDVTAMLLGVIDALDLGRAQLLTKGVYRPDDPNALLAPFEAVLPAVQERITFVFGGRYDRLRDWLEAYRSGEPLPLDHFWSRLFGEVLSQPGFGFHSDFDAAKTTDNLIDSARKFRQMVESVGLASGAAKAYVLMVQTGVIADQYLRGWETTDVDAVLLAPAYTFLMRNHPVDYQFWLNVGGHGWAERLFQPLTNPYVLAKHWPEGRKWTDYDEVAVSTEALYRLVMGLIRRCRKQIYLGFSELGEQGYEQRGELLQAVQRMLRRL